MKVALCLTGLIGSLQGKSWNKSGGTQKVLDTCFTHNKKHILDKNDVDVFFVKMKDIHFATYDRNISDWI